jgi:methyltransferase family protein
MEGFDPRTSFGYDVSRRYDADLRGDEDETVAFLARLAGDRDALELAIGTGRIALPLTRAGIRVDGIEQSPHMIDRMREKPGGSAIDVTTGDMSRATTGRTYGLVYLVYNTMATCSPRTARSGASRTPPATSTPEACSSWNAGYRPLPPAPATSSSIPSRSRPITSRWASRSTIR